VLVLLRYPLVLEKARHCLLYHFLLRLHLLELYPLLLLGHAHEYTAPHEGQSHALVTVAACPAHSVDVGSGGQILVFGGLVIVDDQGNCPDIDTSADGLRPQQHLDLLIPELGDPGGLGGRAVLGVQVVSAHHALGTALPVDVVDLEVDFPKVGGA